MTYPWIEPLLNELTEKFQSNRLPHALLLKGQPGLGKLDLAIALGSRLLCESHSQCGDCKGCQLLSAGTHPDLRLVQPEEDSKQIKIEQVRSLIEWVNQTAQMSGAKVSIIFPAHAMNRSSANGLLKIMEEPPQNNHLILVTDDPAALLPTIRSRAQQIQISVPESEVALTWLKQQSPEISDWSSILALSHGAPLAALAQADPDYIERRHAICQTWGRLFVERANVVSLVEALAKFDLVEVLNVGIDLLADVAKFGTTGNASLLTHRDQTPLIQQVSALMAPKTALFFLARIQRDYRTAKGTQNPNKNLMLEALMIDFIDPGDNVFSL